MKLVKGPRPWAVSAFALLFLSSALHTYIVGLSAIELKQNAYALLIAWEGWNRDWTIVALSAIFSIAFIPVLWIWIFASRIAFWLVTVFAALKLADVLNMIAAYQSVGGAVSWRYFLEPALTGAALICVWLPSSRAWLKEGGGAKNATLH